MTPKPPTDDADFCLMIVARARAGKYIKAHERERVAAIAKEFPDWVKLQRLPTVHNAGVWQRHTVYASAARAAERKGVGK